MSETRVEPAPAARKRMPWVRIAAALGALVALVLLGRQAGSYVSSFQDWIRAQGPAAPLVFIACYALAVMLFVPGSLLTLAGGALFGLMRGTLYVFAGAMLGLTGAFLVARYAARDAVEARIAAHPRFAAIDRAVAEQGRRVVFLLRLSPVFPFSFLNFALGLTRIRLLDYVVASVGILPGTLLYVYYGKVAGDVTRAAAGAAQKSALDYALLGLGLAATVAVTWVVTRAAQRALREIAGPEEGSA